MAIDITAAAALTRRRVQEDPSLVRWSLVALAAIGLGILVVMPLINVFYEALARGPRAYWNALVGDPDTLSAIFLTLRVAPTAVVANLIFGVAAAWAIARFRFPGRTLLTALIDLPFAVSPVVAGLIFVLIFGLQGYLGPWLREHNIKIIFATPGLILATAFVTFPFVARELIPLMEAIGAEEETAAVSLGARAWQILRRITLPNIKWGLLYGIILCNARAMGEFGAVYVVSGHIAGQTDTMPLRVEKLFQEYNTPASFALASLLSSLALVTLLVKTALEWKTRNELRSRQRESALDETADTGPGAVALPPPLRLVGRGERHTTDRREESTGLGISVKNVTKRFGDFVALNDVSIEVPHGELLALLGPSGSGKTTLLRIIAGLEVPDGGSILYQDEDATHRSARDRNVGFVFQHYALFRHMSVFENVAFGLRVRKWKEPQIRERVHELLRLVQLDGMGNQAPSQLSGGQRQRVALARALAAAPKVLLLDEPFGALDAKVRQELRQWLRKLHDEIHVTSVFVTHDQEEAFEVADRVVVMSRGRIEQQGTPQEVFDHPANAFVMDFLGNVNVFHGRVAASFAEHGGVELVHSDPHDQSAPLMAYVRPHELEIDRIPRGRSSLKAEVLRINAAGAAVKVELVAQDFGMPLNVELGRERYAELGLKTGDSVFVFPKRVRVFVQDFQI
ncbi:MAG TPA: sulfate ABC transporter permease subunit CysW [Candidatus Acidoferrales bacterium]|nr:sulfate ABC transporter permease subunit CysW [Candidatus Acidoferrales bacterium]